MSYTQSGGGTIVVDHAGRAALLHQSLQSAPLMGSASHGPRAPDTSRVKRLVPADSGITQRIGDTEPEFIHLSHLYFAVAATAPSFSCMQTRSSWSARCIHHWPRHHIRTYTGCGFVMQNMKHTAILRCVATSFNAGGTRPRLTPHGQEKMSRTELVQELRLW